MRTVEELRQAMADETRDLGPRVTFEQVRARAVRRRRRNVSGIVVAALAPVLVAGSVVALQPAAPGPGPGPTPTSAQTVLGTGALPLPPDPSFTAPNGPAVTTGVTIGDGEELVFWYRDSMNGIEAGLFNPGTGRIRPLDSGSLPRPGKFDVVYEIDDRHGGIIDYGVFGGADARVEVTVGGRTTQASTGRLPQVPGGTLFWVRRDGVLAGPTGDANPPGFDVSFSARDATGAILGTGTQVQRSDGLVNRSDGGGPSGGGPTGGGN